MIVARITGGIGNQLFQYAAAFSLAAKNQTEIKFDVSEYKLVPQRKFELHHFDIPIQFASTKEIPIRKQTNKTLWSLISAVIHPSFLEVINEKEYYFDPQLLTARGDIYLHGYWQSHKYFAAVKSDLIQRLTIRASIPTELIEREIQIKNVYSVGLHVRRGDYLNNKLHPVCSMDYYEQALTYMASTIEKPVFFVFSDDIEWCKKSMKIPGDHYFVSGKESWVDFKLMTSCKHFVIANSTFSWWAAYLGNFPEKKVVAPRNWFNNKNIKIDDLFPDEWTVF